MTSALNLNPSNWSDLERIVAEIYRELGFEVSENVNRFGKQVDIEVGGTSPGIGKVKLFIECKYSESSKSLPASEVREFITDFEFLKNKVGYNKGILVSNAPISKSGKDALEVDGSLEFKTLDQLQSEALQIDGYLAEKILEFETNLLQITHIPGDGEFAHRDTIESTVPRSGKLLEITQEWILGAPQERQLWILGEFGVGKTTFLKDLFCHLGKSHIDDKAAPIPLFIPLSKCSHLSTPREFFEFLASNELRTQLGANWVERVFQNQKIILLCDGFDEMGEPGDHVARRKNYFNVAMLGAANSKTVITCRPSYFVNEREFELLSRMDVGKPRFIPTESNLQDRLRREFAKVFTETVAAAVRGEENQLTQSDRHTIDYNHKSAAIINVSLFSEAQIRDYLQKRRSEVIELSKGTLDDKSLFEKIKDTYDLEDLAQRPILLNLITLVFPRLIHEATDGRFEVTLGKDSRRISDITPAVLYNIQIESELDREYDEKGISRKIAPEKKRAVLEYLGYSLISEVASVFSRDRFIESIRQLDSLISGEDFETEVRSCSFIARTQSDDLKFVHKSFTEFFAASYILKSLTALNADRNLSGLSSTFSEFTFPEGLCYFLGDLMAIYFSQFIAPCHEVKSDGTVNFECRTNLINCLNFSRNWVRNFDKVSAGKIFLLRAENDFHFRSIIFGGISAKRCSFGSLKFESSNLGELEIASSSYKSFDFISSFVDRLLLSDVKAGVCTISDSEVGYFFGGRSASLIVKGSIFSFSNRSLDSTVRLIAERSIVFLPQRGVIDNITARFRDCIFIGGELPSKSNALIFEDCLFLGTEFDVSREVSEAEGLSGFLVLKTSGDDKASSTVERQGFPLILREQAIQKIRQDFQRSLKLRFPNLIDEVTPQDRAILEREYLKGISFYRRLAYFAGTTAISDLKARELFVEIERLREMGDASGA